MWSMNSGPLCRPMPWLLEIVCGDYQSISWLRTELKHQGHISPNLIVSSFLWHHSRSENESFDITLKEIASREDTVQECLLWRLNGYGPLLWTTGHDMLLHVDPSTISDHLYGLDTVWNILYVRFFFFCMILNLNNMAYVALKHIQVRWIIMFNTGCSYTYEPLLYN